MSSWVIPGGGIESDETEQGCVQREMLEETGLVVHVDSLLLDEPSTPGGIYQRWKTYVCHVLYGEARPGQEPEAAYATAFTFTAVGWFDIRYPARWEESLISNHHTHSWLQRVRNALGYR